MPTTVFRTVSRKENAAAHDWVCEEIGEGRLRQGWGAQEFNLLYQNGELVPKDIWENTYLMTWGEEPSPNRYLILARMPQNLTEGHIVVVPKMPQLDQFTIARVSEGYTFDENGETIPQDFFNDFRHLIQIDPDSVRIFHSYENEHADRISGLFSAAQSAVNYPNYDNEILEAAEFLLGL